MMTLTGESREEIAAPTSRVLDTILEAADWIFCCPDDGVIEVRPHMSWKVEHLFDGEYLKSATDCLTMAYALIRIGVMNGIAAEETIAMLAAAGWAPPLPAEGAWLAREQARASEAGPSA